MSQSIGTRHRVALAVTVGGLVAGGAFLAAGGASAGSGETEAGWPGGMSAGSLARASDGAQGADLVVQTEEVRAAGVDLDPAGESPGDFFHFEEIAYKPGTDRIVGRDAVRCELGIRSFHCTGTLRIKGEGKIVIDGALFGERDTKLAITGGTGRFAGVGGTLSVSESDGATLLSFDFVR